MFKTQREDVTDDNLNTNPKPSGCDQRRIMKKWWRDHCSANQNVQPEYEEAPSKIQELQEENEQLRRELSAREEQLREATILPNSIKKETDQETVLKKIGDAVIYIVNIIMSRTQCMTRLFAVKEVIFDNELFGSFAMQKAMKEMATKYARKNIFLPWKVLRSIDLEINGGINYTGVEALRQVEELQKYQQGFLPCRTSIPNCAAELHQLGKNLIPFERVNSDLGEMYQFHYEKLIRQILKTF